MTQHTNNGLTAGFIPTGKQIDALRMAIQLRKARKMTEVLVVDDQPSVSRKIINDTFKSEYKIVMAADAKEGWLHYLTYAPDITFIGIELPDVNGHKLAMLIKAVDATSYIVMSSHHNKEYDLELAKKNNANGFITKPYDNKKILKSIQKFLDEHKSKK